MWTDVVDLRDFYASTLGRVARNMIRARIRSVWTDTKTMSVLGIGYTTPYLGLFRGEAERVLAAMPAEQGVLPWPVDGDGLATLTHELELPFPDLSIDRVLLVHAIESAEQMRPLMREIWRVLSGSGRLLAVVPNRRGIWARFERTPFGHGQPYSSGQLSRMLRESMFTPMQSYKALYVPPVRSRMVLSAAAAWEKVGDRLFGQFAGVVITEAAKQIYAGDPVAVRDQRRSYLKTTAANPGSRRSSLG